MIVEIEVKAERVYAEYVDKVRAIVEKHGGRYRVRGGSVTPLSGDWNPERMIVIEFESAEQVRRCLGSPEYLELAPLREQSTVSRGIVVDGI
jgi:uncharacterized protein (DUF1330 family)